MKTNKQIKKLWLKTYNTLLFTKVRMPGASGNTNIVLNSKICAEKADEVVAEFKSRFG